MRLLALMRRHASSLLVGVLAGLALFAGYHARTAQTWITGTAECVGDGCRADGVALTAHIVALINAQRAGQGCLPLRVHEPLAAASRAYAGVLASRWQQESAVGERELSALAQAGAEAEGYRGRVGRSYLVGLPSPDDVVRVALDSGEEPAAWAPLRDCAWREVGVAFLDRQVAPTFGKGIWVITLGRDQAKPAGATADERSSEPGSVNR